MKKHFIKTKIYFCLTLIILSVVILPVKVLADTDIDFRDKNDVLFWTPGTCGETIPVNSSSSGASNGNIVLIGDSISVGLTNSGIKDKLKAQGYTDITIDAEGSRGIVPVSYTHLTLPTIYSV